MFQLKNHSFDIIYIKESNSVHFTEQQTCGKSNNLQITLSSERII